MGILRAKSLLVVVFFLAIILQVLTPFLHAHTGSSTQYGLHLHVASTGFESAVKAEGGASVIAQNNEESPEVGVPASRESDHFHLTLLSLLTLIYAGLIVLPTYFRNSYSVDVPERLAYQRYSQSSPPFSLAPPLEL